MRCRLILKGSLQWLWGKRLQEGQDEDQSWGPLEVMAAALVRKEPYQGAAKEVLQRPGDQLSSSLGATQVAPLVKNAPASAGDKRRGFEP